MYKSAIMYKDNILAYLLHKSHKNHKQSAMSKSKSVDKSNKSDTNTKSGPKSIHHSGNSAIPPSGTMVCVVYIFNYLEF